VGTKRRKRVPKSSSDPIKKKGEGITDDPEIPAISATKSPSPPAEIKDAASIQKIVTPNLFPRKTEPGPVGTFQYAGDDKSSI
jgi:hypothetical protein